MATNIQAAHIGIPATAVGLAVGSVDDFEVKLFTSHRPTKWEDPNGLAEWRESMIALGGDLTRRKNILGKRMSALKEIEPECNGTISKQVGDLLRPIGAKIAPQLSSEQATAWRKALVMALSDLPPDVSILAIRKAIHTPMKFLNEVEEAVRAHASIGVTRLNLAASKFNDLLTKDIEPIRLIAAPLGSSLATRILAGEA